MKSTLERVIVVVIVVGLTATASGDVVYPRRGQQGWSQRPQYSSPAPPPAPAPVPAPRPAEFARFKIRTNGRISEPKLLLPKKFVRLSVSGVGLAPPRSNTIPVALGGGLLSAGVFGLMFLNNERLRKWCAPLVAMALVGVSAGFWAHRPLQAAVNQSVLAQGDIPKNVVIELTDIGDDVVLLLPRSN